MNEQIESINWTVPLGITALTRAEKLSHCQSNQQKSKQVYVNFLAAYAVSNYLECMGFDTELSNNDGNNFLIASLMNVADLEVKNYGTLECRPVMEGEEFVYIPEEVWSDRIGYVIVQIEPSFQEATLLGFLPQVNSSKVPLKQLQSLEDLTVHLKTATIVKLSQWLDDIIALGWETLETLRQDSPRLGFAFRNSAPSKFSPSEEDQFITRGKKLELPTQKDVVNLCVGIKPGEEPQMDVRVGVYPAQQQKYLPAQLQLAILDDKEKAVMFSEAGNSESLEFRFSGIPGELFRIKLVVGDDYLIEELMI